MVCQHFCITSVHIVGEMPCGTQPGRDPAHEATGAAGPRRASQPHGSSLPILVPVPAHSTVRTSNPSPNPPYSTVRASNPNPNPPYSTVRRSNPNPPYSTARGTNLPLDYHNPLAYRHVLCWAQAPGGTGAAGARPLQGRTLQTSMQHGVACGHSMARFSLHALCHTACPVPH